VLEVDLHLPYSRSLKTKRAVVRPMLEGARQRYSVAAAEVAHQDLWQRAGLGLAAVAATFAHVDEVLDQVERFIWSNPDVEVLAIERRWLDSA
jgi:uncharacterized protein YlxP (DUF503 family)